MGAGATALFATALLSAPAVSADQSSTSTQATQAIGPHTHQIHGVVKGTPSSGATSFTVTTARHGDVTVTTVSSTASSGTTGNGHGHGNGHGNGKGHSSQTATVSGLTDGARVVVHGHTSTDSKTFVAVRMHVLPATGEGDEGTQGTHTSQGNQGTQGTQTAQTAQRMHVVGTISAVSSGSNGTTTLTISPADGSASQAVTVTSEARLRPSGKTAADLKVGTKISVVSRNGSVTGVVVMPS
jgi:hypothetical protein